MRRTLTGLGAIALLALLLAEDLLVQLRTADTLPAPAPEELPS